MQIKINYIDNHYILIKLFDNDTVKKWFEYVSTKNYNYNYSVEQTPPFKDTTIDITYQWEIIKNSIAELNNFGLKLNFQLPEHFDYQQSTLNKLHRFFTYNMLWYDVKEDIPNPFSSQFILDNITKDEWHCTVDVINQAVHHLEKTAALTKNAVSINPPICSLSFIPNKTIDIIWLQFNEVDVKQNYEYFNNTHYPNLVMLDRSILGKCVLQSFSDNDTLTADDCTGRLGSHGGFVIDTNTRRQQVYQSPIFKEWVQTFNLDLNSLPYEFPIGHVIESNFDIENYNEFQYRNVTFIGGAGEIRTHGFRDLQSLALGLSATTP
jgi:hypothetical protein